MHGSVRYVAGAKFVHHVGCKRQRFISPPVLHAKSDNLVDSDMVDTFQDDRFKYSDLVLGEPKIRAYAGAPLLYQRNGRTYKLGTLCIIDASPREVSSEQLSGEANGNSP